MSATQKMLRCFLDGNELCIVTKDFVNLQESDVLFIPLMPHQKDAYEQLERFDNDHT